MDFIFLLIGLFLLTELFYLVRNLDSKLPFTKRTTLIIGIIGIVGVILMFLLLKTEVISSGYDGSVVLDELNITFPFWAVIIVLIVGLLENAILIYLGITGRGTKDNILSDSLIQDTLETSQTINTISTSPNDTLNEVHQQSNVNVKLPPVRVLIDQSAIILIDDIIISSGSFIRGSEMSHFLNEGTHKISISLNKPKIKISDVFTFVVEKDKFYEISYDYSRAWGKFKSKMLESSLNKQKN